MTRAETGGAHATKTRVPRIAVAGMWSRLIHGLRFDGSAVSAAVLQSVIRAGGEPFTLFAESSLPAAERLRGFDALLLPGGFDIDPKRYGEDPLATTKTADMAAQDQFEAELLNAAVAMGLPVLAICRGFQLVNVEHGGTLLQDLPADSLHRSGIHPVQIDAESRLAQAIGYTELPVSSYHHQAIARVGVGLRVVARAPDGIIEALEPSDSGIPLLAVQWHPEDSAAENPQQLAIFRWLITAALEHVA
ncbi:phosphoribosylformylglycinamidine synthase subunit PurQ [Leucobacter sp. UT-8R-CII-1-4]|uniref:gamma-glutamyl-gamma-aminobutyrate hydrolase family protein n=1 Tax=Leucobacter sp. UT-8R-CII-1-4 TaxID=3040075 RepID=UPI0024A8539A|nr:gamma-glutamyl-gamma-aminobutyrate hydrolase family protein [Leucobacter sp. UT-8R-CII-1-4]MDI6022201.1 phosphoribosylformylglycinamidine synthase subunit PurQ [Leucobacter sp. UT-8R-CII-1-4]